MHDTPGGGTPVGEGDPPDRAAGAAAQAEGDPPDRAAGAVAQAGGGLPGEGSSAAAVQSRPQRRAAQRSVRRRRRRRIGIITGSSILGLVLLLAAAGAGYLWYENNRIHRVDIKHLANIKTTGNQKDVENILLIGSTTRCGLKQQNPAFGLCDQGVTGVNSDVVMVLHLDPDHHKASILSIPRDTLVPNARHDGLNKIDAALGDTDGPSQLIAAITDDFGIPIQHYVELNFDTFQSVVGALGSLDMYFPMPVYDLESGLNIPNAGCVTLTPSQALAVVRARHLQYQPSQDAGSSHYGWPYDPLSDLARIRRDHEFLRVMATAVAKRGLGNFVSDAQLIDSLAGNLEVDQGFSATDMANLVFEFHGVDPETVPQYTLPVVVDSQEYFYRGGDYGDVVFPVQPEDAQVVAQFLGTSAVQDPSGDALPSPSSISVAVENGGGQYDEGAKTSSALQALGYQVNSVTDTEVGASTTEATILYSSRSELPDALRVQSSLSGLAVLGYDPGLVQGNSGGSSGSSAGSSGATSTSTSATSATSGGGSSSTTTTTLDVGSPLPPSEAGDVVLVTGSNFTVDVPVGSTPTSSIPGSSSTTSTSTSTTSPSGAGGASTTTTTTAPAELSDNPDLAPPSGSTEGLQPWDPRSCSPTGGPGP